MIYIDTHYNCFCGEALPTVGQRLRDKWTKGWGICNRGECLANDHKVSVSNHSFRLQDSYPLPPPVHFFTSNRLSKSLGMLTYCPTCNLLYSTLPKPPPHKLTNMLTMHVVGLNSSNLCVYRVVHELAITQAC